MMTLLGNRSALIAARDAEMTVSHGEEFLVQSCKSYSTNDQRPSSFDILKGAYCAHVHTVRQLRFAKQ